MAAIDVDEFLQPCHLEAVRSGSYDRLSFPWQLHCSLDIGQLRSERKPCVLFPRGKEILRTRCVHRLRPHTSELKGAVHSLSLRESATRPILHYYCRGIEDLILKDHFTQRGSLPSRVRSHYRFAPEEAVPSSRTLTIAFLLRLQGLSDALDPHPVCGHDEVLMDALRDNLGISAERKAVAIARLKQLAAGYERGQLEGSLRTFQRYFDPDFEGLPLRGLARALHPSRLSP